MSDNKGKLEDLYPFLHGKKQDPKSLNKALIESVRQKAANHHDVIDASFSSIRLMSDSP